MDDMETSGWRTKYVDSYRLVDVPRSQNLVDEFKCTTVALWGDPRRYNYYEYLSHVRSLIGNFKFLHNFTYSVEFSITKCNLECVYLCEYVCVFVNHYIIYSITILQYCKYYYRYVEYLSRSYLWSVWDLVCWNRQAVS